MLKKNVNFMLSRTFACQLDLFLFKFWVRAKTEPVFCNAWAPFVWIVVNTSAGPNFVAVVESSL